MDKRMAYCCKSNWKNTRGCHGCINFRLKRGCNFHGGPNYIYSKEEECRECEQKSHPDRFIGCLFCRSPTLLCTNRFDVCFRCYYGFWKFMVETFSKFVYMGDFRPTDITMSYESTQDDILIKNKEPLVPDFSNIFREWKGFVSKYEDGKYTHTIPEFTEEQIQKIVQEDYRVITWDNIDEILLSYIIKLNISLFEMIQIKCV